MQNPAAGALPSVPSPPVLFDTSTCRSLYVGNLSPKITEALLYEIFSTIGPVESCKLIKDKTVGSTAGYGFVDYFDHETAQLALQSLGGKNIYGYEIKVNWAFAGGHREDTSNHFHIFVGDLSPEIDDKALFTAFSAFGSISDARVMWDQSTGRSRGYGFVAFRLKQDAERALTEMNGEWLGSRAIRCNWANQKLGGPAAQTLDPAQIESRASPTNTTVYVGNLTPDITEPMMRMYFEPYGMIEEIRMQKDKGYAFIRYSAHDSARDAIAGVHGKVIGVRAVKCSWGKERGLPTPPIALPPVVSPPTYATSYTYPSYPYPAQPYPYTTTAYPYPTLVSASTPQMYNIAPPSQAGFDPHAYGSYPPH